ncbi:MAG TPA: cysteine desulfurase [Firmicutes bacterium]|nr:cysteine desulfurase [Bacillota bacterium]
MINLDYHSTTPCDPRVVQAMLPYFHEKFGNPSSTQHAFGREAAAAVRRARDQVANLINAYPQEIIFTSGATESNNLAITGVALLEIPGRRRIVTTKIEHKSVLETCHWAQRFGYEVELLDVDQTGRVNLDHAEQVITSETALVSVQAANNEIGTIQDIPALTQLAHERGALFHCDAAQAIGKIKVDVLEWNVDLMSLSGHKLYGPKGIGVLYLCGGKRGFPILPLMHGGGQEDGLRSGTLNVPAIVGLGEACRILDECWQDEAQRIMYLRDRFEEIIKKRYPDVVINGNKAYRLPGSSSITFPGIDAEVLMANTPDLAWSTGSACNSGALEPSHVLLAISKNRTRAYETMRVGIGRFTTQEDIDLAVDLIIGALERIQQLMSDLRKPSSA